MLKENGKSSAVGLILTKHYDHQIREDETGCLARTGK
jgi:hypothetical protein